MHFVKSTMMMAVVLISAVVFAQAQTADQVINDYITARGGKEKLSSVKSITMEGSFSTQGLDIPMKSYMSTGVGSRQEFEFMGQTFFMLCNMKEGWSFVPPASEPQAMEAEQLKLMQAGLDPFPHLDYAAKGHKVEYIGKETVDGKECHKIKFINKTGSESTEFFDAGTKLMVKSVTKVSAMGQDMEMETAVSDYKAVDGIMFPYATSNMQGSAAFTKIEVNKPVDEKLYTK
jgi:hypothetical protein